MVCLLLCDITLWATSLPTLLLTEITIVSIVCLLAVRDHVHPYRSCLLPLCKFHDHNFYEDARIYQVAARTCLHLDLNIPLCDGSSPPEDVESSKEPCSSPNNRRKQSNLHHDFF